MSVESWTNPDIVAHVLDIKRRLISVSDANKSSFARNRIKSWMIGSRLLFPDDIASNNLKILTF